MTRPDWDSTWMSVAEVIGRRSRCDRAQIGCVIVSPQQRIVTSGYNGPPATFPAGGQCSVFCERARHQDIAFAPAPPPIYGLQCPSVHAELNALTYGNRRDYEGGTLYVTGAICADCAKVIANSGIRTIHMNVNPSDAHRNPDAVIEFLTMCGMDVYKYVPAS